MLTHHPFVYEMTNTQNKFYLRSMLFVPIKRQ